MKLPTAQEVAAIGFTPEDFLGPPVLCWPENRPAALVFLTMRTQWRVGMNGPTGLDYAALPECWRRCGIKPADRDETFASLQIMEQAALAAMHED